MADIKLRILLNENAEYEKLGSVTNYFNGKATNSNISNTSRKVSTWGDIPSFSNETNGSNGLSWAYDYLVFDSSGFLDNVENSGGYLESENSTTSNLFWGVVPENKKYSVKLVFENATSLKDIVVFGDSITKQFPTRAILDNVVEVYSDDPQWAIEFPTSSEVHTIEFTHWNRGNYNATLTGIKIQDKYIVLNTSNGLKEVESIYQTSSNPSDIFYGITPSVGSSVVLDVNGELKDLVADGVIENENVNIDLLANGSVIGSFKTSDTNYGVYNSNLSFELESKLSDWDYLKFEGYDLSETEKSAYDMFLFVFESLGKQPTEVDEMLKTQIVYGNDNSIGSVKEYLSEIKIKYPYLKPDTYRNTITKFCELAQLQIVEKPNGEIIFVSARPVAVPNEIENEIVINSKNQFGQMDRTLLPKNKIASVKVSEKTFVPEELSLCSIGNFDKIFKVNIDGVIEIEENYKNENPNLTYVGLVDNSSEPPPLNPPLIGVNENNNAVYLLTYEHIYKMTLDLSSFNDRAYYKKVSNISVIMQSQDDIHSHTYKKGLFLKDSTNEKESVASEKNIIYETYWAGHPPKLEGDIFTAYIKVLDMITPNNEEIKDYNMIFEKGAKWTEVYPSNNTLVVKVFGASYSDKSTTWGDSTVAPYEIQGNELIQETAMYKGVKMSEIIATNILNDYAEGISDATITLSCADYYNQFGDLVKKWGDGDIINLQDVVVVKKDNIGTPLVTYKNGEEYKWRVKSVTFRKNGVPLVDLKLQEIRPIV